MTYEYNHDDGVLTYTVSEREMVNIREANVPPGNNKGATALRIIEAQRKRMIQCFGKCEVRMEMQEENEAGAATAGMFVALGLCWDRWREGGGGNDSAAMKEWLIYAVIWFMGVMTGCHLRRIGAVTRHLYYSRKYGVCLRYKATGYRENRNGTISDFCQRCGQPWGCHQVPE